MLSLFRACLALIRDYSVINLRKPSFEALLPAPGDHVWGLGDVGVGGPQVLVVHDGAGPPRHRRPRHGGRGRGRGAAVTAAARPGPGSPDVRDNDFIERVVLHFSVVSDIFWIFSLDPRAGEAGGWVLRRELDRHVLDDGGLGPRPPPQSRARILAALRGARLLLLG